MDSIRVAAKTVEDALTEASIQLGTSSDNIEYTVLDEGSKGLLFGIGGRDAVIEAKRKVTDEDLMKEIFEDTPIQEKVEEDRTLDRKEEKKEVKKEYRQDRKSYRENKNKKETRNGRKNEVRNEVKSEGKEEKNEEINEAVKEAPGESEKEAKYEVKNEDKKEQHREHRKETPLRENREETAGTLESAAESEPAAEVLSESAEEPVSESVKEFSEEPAEEAVKNSAACRETQEVSEQKEQKTPKAPANPEEAKQSAVDFISAILKAMDMPVAVTAEFEDGSLCVNIEGENMGILIGKRGQTLDSLQYLTSLVVNKGKSSYVRVKVDTENYRARRKATLENLAKNIAYKVKKTRRPVFLEPMNPYERRIIHSALQNDPYVTTHSEGDEPYRKVVITLKKDRDKGHGYSKYNGERRNNRYESSSYNRGSAQSESKESASQLMEDDDE